MTESEKMEIKRLYQEGVNISDLARKYGRDRKTIRNALKEPERKQAVHQGAKSRLQKLEPFKPYIERQMKKGVLNAVRLLRDIQEQGYTGGITVLREFMQPLRPAVSAKATVRFETDPGEQAQVDLGAFPYIGADGKRHIIWCLAMVLSYSRMLYIEFIKASDQLHILQAMRNAFEFFGGVPKTLLSDNCSSLVITNDGQGNVHWQPAYLDFAKYYGFVPKACKPYRSRTKGKIERPIGYMRQSFWPVEFIDHTDLNHQAAQWRDSVANVRVHGTTREIPLYRFAQERLGSLPGSRYPLGHGALRKVTSDCRVSWNSNLYSVPWEHVGQTVWVRESETGLLQIESGGQIVAEHRVLPGRHLVSADPDHTKGIAPTPQVPHGKVPGIQIGPDVEQRDLAIYEQIALGGRPN